MIREQLCRWFRLDPGRVHVIPNGVDVRRCLDAASKRAQARANLNIGDDICLILGVGNFAPVKGFHHLLDACAQLQRTIGKPNISVVLVGDGAKSRELHEQAARSDLSGRVLFTGRVQPDCVPPLLWAADIVAMPSLQEGVPLTLLEAMACARPLVATRVGGIPDVVEDGCTGLLVPPARPEALAEALAQLARDRSAAIQMGVRAQARAVSEYDHEGMVDRYDVLVRYMASEASYRRRP
jgi:glycosyltransferase involved in cell wall biosynthesis